MPEPDGQEPVAASIDRGWREIAAIDAALEAGKIDAAGWHAAVADLLRPAYLAARTPWEQSGKSGSAADWVASRRIVADAIDRDGTFLDCGCANGYLMECVQRWAAVNGVHVEPYGVDIVPEFVDLARSRLPGWADRFWVANVLTWAPPRRFDVVRVGLDYVPRRRRRDLVAHLLADVVTRGGRLIVGPHTEEVTRPGLVAELASWGHRVTAMPELPHRDPRVVRRTAWVDALPA